VPIAERAEKKSSHNKLLFECRERAIRERVAQPIVV
jgi:hypothetical protein